MADISLVFSQQPSGTDLVFGAEDHGPVAPVDAVLHAALPALRLTAQAIPDARFALVPTLPAVTMRAEARYQSHTARPVVGQRIASWQRADLQGMLVQERSEATLRSKTFVGLVWETGLPQRAGAEHRQAGSLVRDEAKSQVTYQTAAAASPGGTVNRSADSIRMRLQSKSNYGEAQRIAGLHCTLRQQDTWRDRRTAVLQIYTQALHHVGSQTLQGIRPAFAARVLWTARHQYALAPQPGRPSTAPSEPQAPCYTPSSTLRFAQEQGNDGAVVPLIFVCEDHVEPPASSGPVVVPIRRVYWVINHVNVRRVSDHVEVPVSSLALALDAGAWVWGFEATLPATALALVEPQPSGPVELLADVNGTTFRVLAENISRERQFAEASLRIWGRGRQAVLAAPYAPVMNFSNDEARTARQLMEDVLTHDGSATGIPLGWTIDWRLTDWNVPAGVFNHQGPWIDALLKIAGAAGADVLPHTSAPILKVRPRYPVAPWEWNAATPDLVLPADAVSRESLRWLEKPAYNRVFVSGQQIGVLGQVTRAGTAGEILAPMVVDALITEAAVARQRGLAVLADTGRQIEVVLRLPVLDEVGVIEPGVLLEYRDGSITRRGLVRSTRIEAGLPEVWQTLGVQAYA